MSEEDEIDLLINDLISLGALTKAGVDEDGETLFSINSERMKEVYPEFYDLFMEELDEVMISLLEKGLVSVEYDEYLNASFILTEEGRRVIDEMILYSRPEDI